jgi:hypothetical protein
LNGQSDKNACKLGMTVFWLETIATNLSTFWALPEREFFVESLYKVDPDGENHVLWLSNLFILLSKYDDIKRKDKTKINFSSI